MARRRVTQADYLARLDWTIGDARQALLAAVEMGDWSGVRKYAGQIEAAERRRVRAMAPGWKRLRREGGQVDYRRLAPVEADRLHRDWSCAVLRKYSRAHLPG